MYLSNRYIILSCLFNMYKYKNTLWINNKSFHSIYFFISLQLFVIRYHTLALIPLIIHKEEHRRFGLKHKQESRLHCLDIKKIHMVALEDMTSFFFPATMAVTTTHLHRPWSWHRPLQQRHIDIPAVYVFFATAHPRSWHPQSWWPSSAR